MPRRCAQVSLSLSCWMPRSRAPPDALEPLSSHPRRRRRQSSSIVAPEPFYTAPCSASAHFLSTSPFRSQSSAVRTRLAPCAPDALPSHRRTISVSISTWALATSTSGRQTALAFFFPLLSPPTRITTPPHPHPTARSTAPILIFALFMQRARQLSRRPGITTRGLPSPTPL